ncbi:tRNA (guanine-N(1)-)-methyltransferase [Candidatus Photodesmus katoptron]|uniref:tRNA (guanine-N(1)-)-methyltransferase n=1 Tax=Candidatus Photodesmus katoptron Akat1 TaxID=1236703 RepID=S3DJH7_9GAMM|nr:tRNA (guanosine(37)-N1)-methyltransferase TrmD [Candidatus Photodesmus katoptron]EPE37850.1 tRNA methyltransferase [Candidatus Photodesmus katoptron Akat1]KEY90431.1 tRNA (guanine-N(1)-)-methyltransferase [Candidatus Photodesmus katoptron]
MWIGIISLFPEMFRSIIDFGITSKAIRKGIISLNIWNPRDFTSDKYSTVDDKPYGGAPGMLMLAEPLRKAIKLAKQTSPGMIKTIYLSPQGRKLNQARVNELALSKNLLLVCGRYKGIDERIIESDIDEECSIGDFVMTGGEIPAMALIDAVSRFINGVLKNNSSVKEDSFFNGLLDCPHYTRPKILDGQEVPMVLRSGNHKKIRLWRLKQSLGKTWLKKPELLEKLSLSQEQKELLAEFIKENHLQKI